MQSQRTENKPSLEKICLYGIILSFHIWKSIKVSGSSLHMLLEKNICFKKF